ncbi:hypothetical protein Cgig2_018422 [Carnegiea gigantea]|uniref:Uncharacterized protein n=1 Tax=Carnegiea gigantea TaxID=171969 RepID=A0A9Q1JIH8_9CARY|nr:hypothetical protein Cgig2_018422 [Carnegiea gigantea]
MFGHIQENCRKKTHQKIKSRVRSQEIPQEQNQTPEKAKSRGEDNFQLATKHIIRHYVPRAARPKESATLNDLLQINFYNALLEEDVIQEENLEEQRFPLWEDLMGLSQTLEDPWCVLGDFNLVLHQGERIGGLDVTDGEVKDFVACIQHCGLQEFCYEGAFFTWTNKIVWSRINRALHNELWYTFQFCDMWTKDKGFRDMVKHSLAQNQKSSKLKTLQPVLQSLKHPLKQLNLNRYADIYEQQASAI